MTCGHDNSLDRLVEGILLHNATLIPPPLLVLIPRKPRHGMEAIALEDVPAMQSTVIVLMNSE